MNVPRYSFTLNTLPNGEALAVDGFCYRLVPERAAADPFSASNPASTPTVTPTATPTATAIPPMVKKAPEGNTNNIDSSIPAANLYLCTLGPCSGPGEGNLLVTEHATNVHTGDQNADTI